MGLALDSTLIREPRLLQPKHRPLGPVTIDEQHPIAKKIRSYYLLGHATRHYDLASKGNYIHREDASNAVYQGQSIYGPCWEIDGTNDGEHTVLSDPTTGVVDDTAPWTIALSYEALETLGNLHQVCGGYKSTGGTFCRVQLNVTAPGYIYQYNDANVVKSWSWSGYPDLFAVGEKTYVITFDGTNVRIFLNGQGPAGVAAPASSTWSFFSIMAGYVSDGPSYHWLSRWKWLGMWDRALSEKEAAMLYKDPYQFLTPA